MTFVGIERALSGVRMFTVVPRLVRSVSGLASGIDYFIGRMSRSM